MVDVRLEPVVVQDLSTQVLQIAMVQKRDTLALPTDQMMVPLLVQPLVLVLSSPDVGLGDETHALQNAESAIYGRYVDVWVRLFDLVQDLCRHHVACGMPQCGKDHQALGSEPVAGFFEHLNSRILATNNTLLQPIAITMLLHMRFVVNGLR